MRYTIKEILPGQIRVEFEDGSWAIVPVHPDATAEEVDDSVSKYDKDFLPDPESLKNKNISVDEERSSVQISTNSNNNISTPTDGHTHFEIPLDVAQEFSTEAILKKDRVDFGLEHGLDALVIANYYAEQGDTRIKDSITAKVQKFISNPDFSFDEFLQRLEFDSDDIVAQAEAELNG